jgi:hypothetical protein
MITKKEILRQFRQLRVKPSRWAKAEIDELANILVPGECLTHVVFGWYDNGFALLCCTENRVLLIDKKPFFLKLEDLRYDKISEVRFLNRLLDSSVILSYAGMKLEFKSWNQSALRRLTDFVQQTITLINRQQWMVSQDDIPYFEQKQQLPSSQQFWPKEEPKEEPAAATTANNSAMSQGLPSYPEDLMQQAATDLGLMKNPYTPTNKYMRRRLPLLGFNQTSR